MSDVGTTGTAPEPLRPADEGEVAVGPPDGPGIGVFFDLDGTLIDGYSAAVLYRRRILAGEVGLAEAQVIARVAGESPLGEESFAELFSTAAKGWAGRPRSEMDAWGEQMVREEILGTLFHQAWRRVRAHQRRGHTVVIASSASRFQVAPVARELGIEHTLCTELDEDDGGVLTGRLRGRTGWGEGKAELVERFAAEHGLDLGKCWGYANGDEDVPFLAAVGRPVAVNPQPALAQVAADRGWPVVAFTRPSASSWDPRPWLRTAAVYGSFLLASGLGVAHGVLRGDRRAGVDFATSLLGPISSALSEIDVEVSGEAHVWSHRPAVFLINHQSTVVDLVATARVLRSGFTAVAKAGVRDMPVFGWLMEQADVAFVERDGSGGAAAIEDAVARLRAGTSVVVAPEGTRSTTPGIGEFKKGGFRMASAAGVPVVPVVIRNAGELNWKDSTQTYAGTVQVHVHPPVPVGPTRADVEDAARTVRDLYIATLEEWPGTE